MSLDAITRAMAARRARIRAALALGTEWINARGDFCGAVTRDPADPAMVRLTLFDSKGPWGHRPRADLAALVDVILDDLGPDARVEPGCVDRLTRASGGV